MIGFVGAQLTQLLLDLFPKLRITTTDIVEPPKLTSDERLKVVKCDLGDIKQVEALFEGEKIGGVFALQYVHPTSGIQRADVEVESCLEEQKLISHLATLSMLIPISISLKCPTPTPNNTLNQVRNPDTSSSLL
jgi:hypothetical protein